MLKSKDILQLFHSAGYAAGDIVVVQSSYKGTGGVEGGPAGLIDILVDLVGTTGTLVMPAYNFESWTEKQYFHIKETPSKVGAIPEIFRTRPGVRRTRHPIHSLSVLGRHQDELCAIDSQDAFANDSTFAYLLKKNALYVSLGLDLEMPFLPCHFPETQMKVPYRSPKLFTGTYVDESGASSNKSYGFHVRADVRKRTPVYDAHIMQYERGAVKELSLGSMRLLYSRAEDYHRSMIDIIKEYPEMFA